MKTKLIAPMLIATTSALLTAMPAVAAGRFAGELLLGDSDQALATSANVVYDGGKRYLDGFAVGEHTNSYAIRGSYQSFKYLAVELGYQKYGKFSSGFGAGEDYLNLTFDADSINLGVKGILPLSETYSLNARLGLSDWDMNTTTNNASFMSTASAGQGTDIYYAVGADHQINDNLFVGLNYSVVTMKWEWSSSRTDTRVLIDFENEIKTIALSLGVRF